MDNTAFHQTVAAMCLVQLFWNDYTETTGEGTITAGDLFDSLRASIGQDNTLSNDAKDAIAYVFLAIVLERYMEKVEDDSENS